jgi:hypothetical protein
MFCFDEDDDDELLDIGIDLGCQLKKIERKIKPLSGKKLKKKRKKTVEEFVKKKYGGKPGPAWREGTGCKSCNPLIFDKINKFLIEGRSYTEIQRRMEDEHPIIDIPDSKSISRHHKQHTDVLVAAEEIYSEVAGVRSDIRRIDIKINTIEEIEKTIVGLDTRLNRFDEIFRETGKPDKNEIPFLKEKTRLLTERDKAIERSMENREKNKALMVGEVCSIMMMVENKLGGPTKLNELIQILKQIRRGKLEEEITI